MVGELVNQDKPVNEQDKDFFKWFPGLGYSVTSWKHKIYDSKSQYKSKTYCDYMLG